MYFETNGTPTEWNTCAACGHSAQHDRYSVLNHFPTDRKPTDPVEAFCRSHFPSGPAAFDRQQMETIMSPARRGLVFA